MMIRPATERDIPEITTIYNEVVANSAAVWTEKQDSEAERVAWMNARRIPGSRRGRRFERSWLRHVRRFPRLAGISL
jgi:L-amino acid N-acyltransferase YncA